MMAVREEGILSSLLKAFAKLPETKRLGEHRTPGSTLQVKGLKGSAYSLAVAALQVSRGNAGTTVVLMPSQEDASYLFSDLQLFFPEYQLYYLPCTLRDTRQALLEPVIQRNELVACQSDIASGTHATIVVTYLQAVAERFATSSVFKEHAFSLHAGSAISPRVLCDRLVEEGFEQVDFVYEPGQFARRGSIVDLFSLSDTLPFRIDFLGNTVDSLRQFDVDSQQSVRKVETISVIPPTGGEGAVHETSLLEILPAGALVWGEEIPEQLLGYENFYQKLELRQRQHFIAPLELKELFLRYPLVEGGLQLLGSYEGLLDFHTVAQPPFQKNFSAVAQRIETDWGRGIKTYISAEQPSQLARLQAIFDELGVPRERYTLVQASLWGGFSSQLLELNLFTDHQIFDRYHKYTLRKQLPKRDAFSVKEMQALKPGDYVVHADHGVGVFEGLIRTEENGVAQEYVRLSYQDKDTILVSIHNLHRLSKYRGKEGEAPVISKLGSAAWSRMKAKAKGKVKDIARDLIQLYARRREEKGFAYGADTYLQETLEASFIYQDTPDQLEATRAVKADMERPVPMDRLVCGDVGFGKTEIAIRAAFKAVSDSKQVAVLVPTTVLALQHYKTFSSRLAEFPCNVELLSRMRTAKEQAQVLDGLAKGTVDIVIGTHAILRKGLNFKDLGLLIVDEEQKFGVAAKEKLKALRGNVDTLTLTATPIPRTLQFSLMGARDLSIISTPPPNRFPIQTTVTTFDPVTIAEAIRHEVTRGGQVFFVHNQISTLSSIYNTLHELLPDIRIVTAHGKMKPADLEAMMLDFMAGDYDVLLSTSIVEAGLDIPNANTIIINNGHRFGLSDLHQLRGRVGRANKKAYCYILVPDSEALTPEARRRLRAIEEFADLGSGINIAMQDLDIRGAGNLLGAEQSGFIVDLGFEAYHRILDEALYELKTTEFRELFQDAKEDFAKACECIVETDLDISLPETYVANPEERIRLYREIDTLRTAEELEKFSATLQDRFGPLPKQAKALVQIPPLKWKAASMGVEKIQLRRGTLTISFSESLGQEFIGSAQFSRMLDTIQQNPKRFRIRQQNEALRIDGLHVGGVDDAMQLLSLLAG